MMRTEAWLPWTEWECYRAGMYDGGIAVEMQIGREMYATFLRDVHRFGAATRRVLDEWPRSCLHFLSKTSINRVAWMGQAAACIDMGLSRKYRSGFMLLSSTEKHRANLVAIEAIKLWEHGQG